MRELLATETTLELWVNGPYSGIGAEALAMPLVGPAPDVAWWLNAAQSDVDEVHSWFLTNKFYFAKSTITMLSGALLTAFVVGLLWWLNFPLWITVGASVGAAITCCAVAACVVDWVGDRFFGIRHTVQVLEMLRPLSKSDVQELFDHVSAQQTQVGMWYFKAISQRRRPVYQDAIIVEQLMLQATPN